MFLGYRLQQLRRNRQMSQQDLGKELGVSKVSISGYEKGSRVPSMEVLIKILKLFDISADYILGRELNVVCEGEPGMQLFSQCDIEIIKAIRDKPRLYNKIAKNPQRFFECITKK